jgi:hypothetical protein
MPYQAARQIQGGASATANAHHNGPGTQRKRPSKPGRERGGGWGTWPRGAWCLPGEARWCTPGVLGSQCVYRTRFYRILSVRSLFKWYKGPCHARNNKDYRPNQEPQFLERGFPRANTTLHRAICNCQAGTMKTSEAKKDEKAVTGEEN